MSEHDHQAGERAECGAMLAGLLAEARDLRRSATGDPLLGRRRLNLRGYQAARLARTHADLLSSARYAVAASFFLSDLYGASDLGARDAEVERILPLMATILPVSGLRTLLLAVEVDALSERFDGAMIGVLGERLDSAELSPADYGEAYRRVGDRAGRMKQIRLIGETGEALDALARKSFVRGALKMMHGPAHLAGLGELHAFLERGFEAFRSMGKADDFLEAITERELDISRALFAGREISA